MDYTQAQSRFREAQERLKSFLEENCEYTINGLEFVGGRDVDGLAREYARLKAEHDAAGAEWAASLETVEVMQP